MSEDTANANRHSLMARVLGTPVGDLLRGRVTGPIASMGRLETIVRAGHLPEALEALVLKVTRRTRLRRAEKAEVARELVAHFLDGIDAGRDADALVRDFGDPIRAARLIRRAKKRNRSVLWHAWVNTWKAIACFLLVCAAIYGILAVRYWTGHPTIKRNFIAEMNAGVLTIPEADRAWPLYRAAYLAMPVRPEAITLSKTWPRIGPGEPGWEDSVAYVDSAQATITTIREAAARPHLGIELSSEQDPELLVNSRRIAGVDAPPDLPPANPDANPPLITVLLPHLGFMRDFARHLQADALVAMSRGEGPRVAADVEAMVRMASHCAEQPFLVAHLVSLAIDAVAFDTLGMALEECPSLFGDDELVRLAHLVGTVQTDVDPSMERAFFEDTVQRMYSDNGRGDGRLVAGKTSNDLGNMFEGGLPMGGPAGPMVSAFAVGRKEIVREWDRIMGVLRAEAMAPMWTWKGTPGEAETMRLFDDPWYRARYFPISALVPAVGRIAVAANTGAMRRDALAAAIALELYRRAHGEYPASLAELAPRYLPAVPVDRFDGGTLKLLVSDGRATVYSAGRDMKDDGGVPPPEPYGNDAARRWGEDAPLREPGEATRQPHFDGDWVIWPPLRYDQEGTLLPRG